MIAGGISVLALAIVVGVAMRPAPPPPPPQVPLCDPAEAPFRFPLPGPVRIEQTVPVAKDCQSRLYHVLDGAEYQVQTPGVLHIETFSGIHRIVQHGGEDRWYRNVADSRFRIWGDGPAVIVLRLRQQ